MTLDLTLQELELILKTLDSIPTRGIETQRVSVGLADKITKLMNQNGSSLTPTPPTG